MLTGTLVTAAGFLPTGRPRRRTGEYTRLLFQGDHRAGGVVDRRGAPVHPVSRRQDAADMHKKHGGAAHDPHSTLFYKRFRTLLDWCLPHRKFVIAFTVAAFVASILLFRFVPQQFFRSRARTDGRHELAEGSSLRATEAQAKMLETMLAAAWLTGKLRRVRRHRLAAFLPRRLDQQLPAANFAQFVVRAEGHRCPRSRARMADRRSGAAVPDVATARHALPWRTGSPVGYPVQFRAPANTSTMARDRCEVEAKVREPACRQRQPRLGRAEQGGAPGDRPGPRPRTGRDLGAGGTLGLGSMSGLHVSTYREGNELIEVLLRGPTTNARGSTCSAACRVPTGSASVPLSQIASLRYVFEDGIIWHRDRLPTVTVRADIHGEATPPTVVGQIAPTLDEIRAALPEGYLLQTGGTVEDSRGQNSIKAGMPLFCSSS